MRIFHIDVLVAFLLAVIKAQNKQLQSKGFALSHAERERRGGGGSGSSVLQQRGWDGISCLPVHYSENRVLSQKPCQLSELAFPLLL